MDRTSSGFVRVGRGIAALAAYALGCFSIASADCSYDTNILQQYLSMCRQQDGCVYAEQMRSIVAQSCGQQGAAQQPSAAPPAAPTIEPDPDSGDPGPSEPPSPKPQPDTQTQVSLPPNEDHSGKPCQYFTGRAAVESDGTVMRTNYYSNEAKVCYGDRQYICTKGRWQTYLLSCPANGKRAEDLER